MASYIFEDAPGTGGYSSVTPQQIKDALAGSGLDQSSQQSVFNTILPPAPTRSTQGSSGRYGGVDWKSILANDPFQRQLEADLSAESASDSANRKVAIDKALAQFGMVPDFLSQAGSLGLNPDTLKFLQSDVDQSTRDLANKNTQEGLSIYARLQKQNQDNIRNIKRALAARGMAASGESGHQLGEEALRFKQDMTDNEQKLLDYITGVVSAFTQAERGRTRDKANGLMSATERALQLYGMSGDGGSSSAGGGAGPLQYSSGAQSELASRGFSGEQVSNAIYSTMAERGWGQYHGAGGAEAPQVMENGQVFMADGVTPWNGSGPAYIRVKVGTSQGNSTETVPIGTPGGGGTSTSSGSSAPAPSGGGGNTVSYGDQSYLNPFGLNLG